MKYSGTIVGFQSKYGSIYNIITDDPRCYTWKANIIAEIDDKMIKIVFNWNGESYEIKLTSIRRNYYTGNILCNREEGGTAFFWRFNNEEGLILKGDFIEDYAGNYDCFIELKELKNVVS